MIIEFYHDPFDLPYSDSKKIFILVSTSRSNIEEEIEPLVNEINSRMPNAALIGSSSSSLIKDGKISEKDLLITVVHMEASYAHSMLVQKDEKFLKSIKTKYNALLRKRKERKLLIAFGTTLINGDEVLESITNIDKDVCVAGGLAEQIKNASNELVSFVFSNNGVTRDGFALVMLYGENLKYTTDVNFNWIPMGHSFLVTKSDRNRVFELDHTPIKEIYEKYLGEELSALIENNINEALQYPMLIEEDGLHIARAIINVDDTSYTYAGNIKEGQKVFFGFANVGTTYFGEEENHENIKKSEIIFIYSCIARKMLLGGNISYDNAFYSNIAQTSGFYTYGEFFHYGNTNSNKFLNQTMTVLGLWEKENNTNNDVRKKFISKKKEHLSGGIKRRATNHFVKTVTSELSKALDDQKRMLEEEKRLKKIISFQATPSSIHKTMKILKDDILHYLKQVNISVMDVYFKDNIQSLSSYDIQSMKSQVDISKTNISNILDAFSILTSNDNSVSEFSLYELFQNIHVIFALSLIENQITLFLDFVKKEENDFKIVSKKSLIAQALVAILINAIESIKRSNNNGKIIITITKIDDNYVMSISDNGVGFDGDLRSFFTCHKSSEGESGTSLYLLKNLIEHSLSGRIHADKNKNEGITIRLKIPTLAN